MKVCIIGDFSDNRDEGLKNIAHSIAECILNESEIILLPLNICDIFSIKFIRSIFRFCPDIIHYIPGPSNKSLLFLKLLEIYFNNNIKIVLSATYPTFNENFLRHLRFKPDYIFLQSSELHQRMELLGIPSMLIPNGVNTKKFKPVLENEKLYLRNKYHLEKDKFTLVHVGHIKENRNLEALIELAVNAQIIIVASNYLETDLDISERLKSNGILVFHGYFPNVEEFYQLSDCYVFPVKPGDSICCPLSVMEAMACNLPVATTEFNGIKTFFEEGDGLFFIKDDEHFNITEIVGHFKGKSVPIHTREKVEQYSWQNIAKEMIKIYKKLTKGDTI